MEYDKLPHQHQAALLEKRLVELQQDHFIKSCELEEWHEIYAVAPSDDSLVALKEIDGLKAALLYSEARIRIIRAKLEAARADAPEPGQGS